VGRVSKNGGLRIIEDPCQILPGSALESEIKYVPLIEATSELLTGGLPYSWGLGQRGLPRLCGDSGPSHVLDSPLNYIWNFEIFDAQNAMCNKSFPLLQFGLFSSLRNIDNRMRTGWFEVIHLAL
jgi:hypothetical protein